MLRLSNKNVTQKQWHYEKLANCCTFQEGGPQFAGCHEKPQDELGGRSLKRKNKPSEYYSSCCLNAIIYKTQKSETGM